MNKQCACPKCHQLFPSMRAIYQHWKETGHVEIKRADEEIENAPFGNRRTTGFSNRIERLILTARVYLGGL